MKKIIFILLAITLVLSMVFISIACKAVEETVEEAVEETVEEAVEETPAEEEEFTKEVTLSVSYNWFGGDAHAPFIEWALADFQEQYPTIKLDTNEIPTVDIRQKVRSDFMAGVATDIILWYGGAESYEFVKEDLLLDLSEILKPMEDGFINGALENVSFNGKNYGLPLCQNFFALYLNMDIYDEYGFEYPKTYEELKEQVIKFKADGLIPIMLPGQNHPLIQHFYSFVANQVTDAGTFDAASHAEGKSFDDPGFVKAAEIIAELSTLGAFDPNIDGIPITSVEDQFSLGEGAMYFAGIWRVGSLPAEIREKMQPILFPEVEGITNNANVATSQTEMAWIVNKSVEEDQDKLEAIKLFLEFFADKNNSQKHAELTDTIVPIQEGVDLSSASNAVKESAKLVANAELRPFLRYYQSPAQGGATSEMTWALINGRGTVEDNLKKLLDIPPNER